MPASPETKNVATALYKIPEPPASLGFTPIQIRWLRDVFKVIFDSMNAFQRKQFVQSYVSSSLPNPSWPPRLIHIADEERFAFNPDGTAWVRLSVGADVAAQCEYSLVAEDP